MHKLFKIQPYFYFTLKSKNQHGVHSPFVFSLITKCFYKKSSVEENKFAEKLKQKLNPISNKRSLLLARVIYYFNPKKSIFITEKNNEIFNNFEVTSNFSTSKQRIYNLVFFHKNYSETEILEQFKICLEKINNNSVVIFNNIHLNSETNTAWKFIQKHPKVTVTIDTFKWGFVFFRKEQTKEHFIIRT